MQDYFSHIFIELTSEITWENAGMWRWRGPSWPERVSWTAPRSSIGWGHIRLYDGRQHYPDPDGGTYGFVNHGTLEQTGGGTDTLETALTNTALVSTVNGDFFLRGPVITLAFNGGSHTQGSFAAQVSDGHGGTLIKFV